MLLNTIDIMTDTEIDHKRLEAYIKIEKSIESCTEFHQLLTVENMIKMYVTVFSLDGNAGDVVILSSRLDAKHRKFFFDDVTDCS
jgi:hypothetical protein